MTRTPTRRQRVAPGDQRLDYLGQEALGGAVGSLAGGAEEQQGEHGDGAAVERGGEPCEPLAWDGQRVRRCHRGPAPLGVSGWCGSRHRHDRASPRPHGARRAGHPHGRA
jgi:hypothetical protein